MDTCLSIIFGLIIFIDNAYTYNKPLGIDDKHIETIIYGSMFDNIIYSIIVFLTNFIIIITAPNYNFNTLKVVFTVILIGLAISSFTPTTNFLNLDLIKLSINSDIMDNIYRNRIYSLFKLYKKLNNLFNNTFVCIT